MKDVDHEIVYNYAPDTFKVRGIILTILYFFSLNLTFVKDLSGMRYIGVANVVIYMFVMFLVVIQFLYIRDKYVEEQTYKINYIIGEPKMNWFSGIATILLAFLSHPTFFNVRDELSEPSPARVRKIVRISVLIETVLFLTIAIFGYLSLGDTHMVDMFVLRAKFGKIFIKLINF